MKILNYKKLKIRLIALWEEENVDGNTDLISFFKVEKIIDELVENDFIDVKENEGVQDG